MSTLSGVKTSGTAEERRFDASKVGGGRVFGKCQQLSHNSEQVAPPVVMHPSRSLLCQLEHRPYTSYTVNPQSLSQFTMQQLSAQWHHISSHLRFVPLVSDDLDLRSMYNIS
jgi:hypothetical protein